MEKITSSEHFESISKLRILDLLDRDFLNSLCLSFTEITGLATAIADIDGTILVATGWQDLCTKYHRKNPITLKRCLESDNFLNTQIKSGENYTIYKCQNGLIDAAIPIIISGRHLGNLYIGQFFIQGDKPNEEYFRNQAEEVGIKDVEGYIEAYNSILSIKEEQVKIILNFLAQILELIGHGVSRDEELLIMFSSTGNAIIITDLDSNIEKMNTYSEKLTGYKLMDVKGEKLNKVFNIVSASNNTPMENPVSRVLKYGQYIEENSDTVLHSKDKSKYYVSHSAGPMYDNRGNKSSIVIIFRDISDKIAREIEKDELVEKLAHSQRLEAVGQLAGGVAHDFNNMLSGVIGAAELLKSPKLKLDEKGLKYVDLIIQAVSRASDLTNKLLTFSSKNVSSLNNIYLHELIDESVGILDKSIDKKNIIKVNKSAENDKVLGDKTNLQNVIINLGINSSHAMPNGGEITISTKNIYLDAEYCKDSTFDVEPGNYIKIDFRDNGQGISSKNIKKIFEPFFTTKEQGKGTGLGLSTVYGVVKEHNGIISVYSAMNFGTVFHIYIPCSTVEDESVLIEEKKIINGAGNILFVDDEDLLRLTGEKMLKGMGYNVFLAANGLEAIDIYKKNRNSIDVVIMDMVMPVMSGYEAFYKLREIDKDCRIIISSGFTKDGNIQELKSNGLDGFIHKPYRNYQLGKLLDHILKK